MKRAFAFLGAATLAGMAAGWSAPEDPEALSWVVVRPEALHRVTKVPHRMADSTAALCRISFNLNPHEGDRDPAFCLVYTTPDAKGVMTSGKGRYPRGAVIVKSKLAGEKSSDVLLYTTMRKREAGYDARNGDWEYGVLDGRSKRVLAAGRIETCIACHRRYASTDYVTRAYLPSK
ncbi:MAG: cytochrome P460 family protein [Armatimonadota bacterium]